jgi:sodium/potassium-transporting ATPase subunit alpha
VAKKYNVSINTTKAADSLGLSSQEALKRIQEHGPNRLTPAKKIHPILMYLKYVAGIFNLMLIVAGIASLILYGIDKVANVTLVRRLLT